MITDAEKQMIAAQNMVRSDRQNNERWAYKQQQYWHDKGHTNVKCVAVESAQPWTDADGNAHSTIRWHVETNLIGGLPPAAA